MVTQVAPYEPSLTTGKVPAIVLENPKYPHNVAQVLRVASCYGFAELRWSGYRVPLEGYRLPREERMRGYAEVEKIIDQKPIDPYKGIPIIGVELTESSQNLAYFEHPDDAVYVFGPEDGGISKGMRMMCHQFVAIQSYHCFNLAVAVGTILYDRQYKRQMVGLEEVRATYDMLKEDRGFYENYRD